MAFNFPLMRTDRLTPDWVKANQRERMSALPAGAWPCNTLNNHDAPRVFSRYGDGKNDADLARISIALLLTLRGTPFLYNGEEIGMTDLLLTDVDQFRDNVSVWVYHTLRDELGLAPADALQRAARIGRDKCRTPTQWADDPNAGFSPAGIETWLPVNANYAQGVNVADQLDDADSLLSFYRRLLRVRTENAALIAGDYDPLDAGDECIAFLRRSQCDGQSCLVVLNTSDQRQTLGFDLLVGSARLLFSNRTRESDIDDVRRLDVAPFEVFIAELS
jgi:alpha-glucosidase